VPLFTAITTLPKNIFVRHKTDFFLSFLFRIPEHDRSFYTSVLYNVIFLSNVLCTSNLLHNALIHLPVLIIFVPRFHLIYKKRVACSAGRSGVIFACLFILIWIFNIIGNIAKSKMDIINHYANILTTDGAVSIFTPRLLANNESYLNSHFSFRNYYTSMLYIYCTLSYRKGMGENSIVEW
jgi:hypothetical protein